MHQSNSITIFRIDSLLHSHLVDMIYPKDLSGYHQEKMHHSFFFIEKFYRPNRPWKNATMFVKAWAHINKLLLNNISNPSTPSSLLSTPPELTPCFDRGMANDPDGLGSPQLLVRDFAFTADLRARMDPPVLETYFGNCVSSYWFTVGHDQLRGEDGILVAAEGLSQLVRGLESGEALRGAKGKLNRLMEALIEEVVEGTGVAGSPRFGVYGSDFGRGRPRKVEVTSIDATGAVSMAECRDGNGSVEVGLVLDKHQMEVLGSLFAGGLD